MSVSQAQLQTRLEEAREALHQLAIGRRSSEVTVDGYMVKYTRANIGDLEAYIVKLEAQLRGCSGGNSAIGVYFG